jgi:hypothetical protein
VADATALLVKPVSTAMASRVSVALTVTGPLYFVEEAEGAVPLAV